MRLNMNSPLMRLSVDLAPEQITTLVKAACDMATEEDSQDEDVEDIVVKGFAPDEPEAVELEPEEASKEITLDPNRMEEIAEKYTSMPPLTEQKSPEKSEGYTGFLHLKCGRCGAVKSFCTKVPLGFYKCPDGHKTELANLRKIDFYCECGRHFYYQTNLEDDVITMECFQCGSPVDLEWNRKKQKYERMK